MVPIFIMIFSIVFFINLLKAQSFRKINNPRENADCVQSGRQTEDVIKLSGNNFEVILKDDGKYKLDNFKRIGLESFQKLLNAINAKTDIVDKEDQSSSVKLNLTLLFFNLQFKKTTEFRN